jgi:hypothetical protein
MADAGGPEPAAAPSTKCAGGAAPLPLPCDAPGRRAYELWRTKFVLDERYEPVKVRGGGGRMAHGARDGWGAWRALLPL